LIIEIHKIPNEAKYGFIGDNGIIEVSAEDYLTNNYKGLKNTQLM